MSEISPIRKLVEYQKQLEITKVTPTRLEIVEEISSDTPQINNLFVNINLNLDKETFEKALEHSAQMAKGLAMAMLGTAFFFTAKDEKKIKKVKLPEIPKAKIPKL